jgi:putative membrane-bound dehydrogenase-like protein
MVSFPRPSSFHSVLISLAIACIAHPVAAENPLPEVERLKSSPVLRHLKPNPVGNAPATQAAQTVAQMYVPEGFRVELIASEPQLHQPVAFAWDERGRLWVVEAMSYPSKRPEGQGLDRILIFEDRDGDGTFKTCKVFAEGLNLVSAIEVGYGGVWVGAAPQLLFIPDRDHDDVPDGPPQVMLDGFGYQDTHECMNSFMWGPDGWLYGNQGVFNTAHIGVPGAPPDKRVELRAGVWRYHPVRHQFEVFAHGGSNPWGLDYDEHGQIFMTHCRSYWGRGPTTHVIQGGHYWNQSNANHAPFIIGTPPEEFPTFRNYLLASARYDHGAGGAGVPGSDAIYGGHSHVGTMIYLGDNWPDEFRGHLFTHNLGGHQMNQQVNQRLGSGFNTVHAGRDQLFCTDPKYVAVDLQYGPDGAVYIIDWYDQQHCHNPNVERWDRSNGRIYRMEYAATYKPAANVDLGARSDLGLVELLTHKNAWFGRMAQKLLAERAALRTQQPIDAAAKARVLAMASEDADPLHRLHALWAAKAIGAWSDDVARKALADSDEYVRAWGIQLQLDGGDGGAGTASQVARDEMLKLAKADPSAVVRLYLASAIQRLPEAAAWAVTEALAQHGEDREDRNLPLLLWDGLAQRMPEHLDRAFAVAGATQIPQLADYIYWYAATLEGSDGLERVVATLKDAQGDTLRRRLAGLWLAIEPRANVAMPAAWKQIAPMLYASVDLRVRQQAERLAAAFGDDSAFPRLRQTLADPNADAAVRKHALAVLGRAPDRAALPAFLRLLDEPPYRAAAINVLARFGGDAPQVAEALIARLDQMTASERTAALAALTSRPSFAIALLDAIASHRVKRDRLNALHVRQLTSLHDAKVDQRVTATWGRILQSPAEKQAKIEKLVKTYDEAPLWAYDAGAGRQHFQKLCMSCHRIAGEGVLLGPELTGAGKNGARYFIENIIDPDAVIGADYQMTVITTKAGDVLSGIVGGESASTVTLRTAAGEMVIAKAGIVKRETSAKSLMPEGLLESLGDREQLELLKFLVGH